ncbi:MAG: DnaJ domain-containing protein [Anaerolineae bacterium]|nr:DnaJ domain-containing protein [Anaerolineae bacterium]
MTHEGYYQILGVDRHASREEIQEAFHTLARKYHPDANPDPRVVARFKEISAAYEVLSDARQRAKYDLQIGTEWSRSQQAGSSSDARWRQQTTYTQEAGMGGYRRQARATNPIKDNLGNTPLTTELTRLASILVVIFLAISFVIDMLPLVAGALSIGGQVFCIALPIIGGLLSLGLGLCLRKRSTCPKCRKPWAREILRKEKGDVFYRDVPFDGLPPIPHVRYRVQNQCKYCGHRWISTQAEKLWRSFV